MDNVTHSLVGVFLSRIGLNRLAPDATWISLVAANAPDIDVVSGMGGAATLLRWHRGLTHSLLFSLVLAILAVAAVRVFSKVKTGWLPAIAVAWAGVLSHILLDLTNNYGVRLFEPLNHRWFEWNLTYIIDPYIWAVLILAFVAPLLGRLLSSEMSKRKRGGYSSRAWPALALGFIFFSNCVRLALHTRAVATIDARLINGEAPLRAEAFPTPLNPFEWQVLIETSDRYSLDILNLSREFRPNAGKVFYKNDPDTRAVSLLRARDAFGALIDFTQFPLWRVSDDENYQQYRLTDLRFGDPVQQTFTCSARLAAKGAVADERCDFSFRPNYGTP